MPSFSPPAVSDILIAHTLMPESPDVADLGVTEDKTLHSCTGFMITFSNWTISA